MMKSIVEENLVSFKVLEQKVFSYVCELGRMITQIILENYEIPLTSIRSFSMSSSSSVTSRGSSDRIYSTAQARFR